MYSYCVDFHSFMFSDMYIWGLMICSVFSIHMCEYVCVYICKCNIQHMNNFEVHKMRVLKHERERIIKTTVIE